MDEKKVQVRIKRALKKKIPNHEIKSCLEAFVRPEKEMKNKPTEREKEHSEKEGIDWR